ncbi:NAD(P)-binding protein [Hypoxylon rubiginosum]|uniref:NAD(P)-binding protein n=1 Tax=Hypoxylon rubiginosum TaxID=110542 RepID=A0ACC0DLE8_9PEZI|nr:NAD(P)-binding protein [Hypoxylon rubiginosum]
MEKLSESNSKAPKVAIVTGAASGIGKALAAHLIKEGWRVACCDIQQDAGSAAAAELGGNAAFFQLDVSNYEEQAKVFSQVWEKWGRLDALLANAGHSDRSSIYIFDHRGKKEIPPKPALLSIKACYESLLYGVQLAIHFMRQNVVPGGQIIATSTIASVHPHQTFPEYCGAKAAINQFVRTAAPILKLKENITLNAVLPGIVITGAVPQASVDATKPEHITPIKTVVDAYILCLARPGLNGQLIECSTDKHFFLPLPEMANGEATKRACTVWEPLFEQKHHEKSGLPNAIP